MRRLLAASALVLLLGVFGGVSAGAPTARERLYVGVDADGTRSYSFALRGGPSAVMLCELRPVRCASASRGSDGRWRASFSELGSSAAFPPLDHLSAPSADEVRPVTTPGERFAVAV